ncbi:MAG: hypothetical protein ABSA45_04835 [Verrucomicrobiota bacterium]|jgi:hypothetical protein
MFKYGDKSLPTGAPSKRLFYTSILLLAWLFISATAARGGFVQIGYTNCLAVTNFSQSLMNEIGQLKWYFAHASVGGNMMDGIADLHGMNPNFYQFHGVSEDGNPPATTETGGIYEYMRGNPGWQVKVDTFQTYVSNGWRFPKVNFALNKMCWIDPTADLNYYIRSMTNLEAAFPQTMFVYATMPLNTSEDNDNYLRSLYNDGLRDWCRTNNRVLFDIADVESRDTSGALCSFTWNSRICQKLYSGYTDDGGHLNTQGRQLVARGFYALSAALLAVDRDNDGLTDGRELLAGTCPTDGQDVFKIINATRIASGALVVQWTSASNRLYTLQRGTNILDTASFTCLLTNIAATPPSNTGTDSLPAGETLFYRVGVRQ